MKAVIYARYSSDNQREESIEGQIRECTEYAKYNDIEVVGHYIDRAYSAKTDKRPDFQRMIKDSAKKNFQLVIVWKLDRFARNRYDSAIYKAALKKNGVRVISVTEHITDDATGGLMDSMFEGFAEYYSAELAEKTKRGMKENALKGKWNGGQIPFGYMVKDSYLAIDETLAPIVRKLFEMCADGITVKDIHKYVQEKGILRPNGKKITYSSLRYLLSNRVYIGEYRHSGIIHENVVPAIVDKEVYDRAQEQISRTAHAPARHKAEDDYLLTLKLYCGHCGALMTAYAGTSMTGTLYRYYACNRARKKLCDKKRVNKQKIEDFVIYKIVELLKDGELLEYSAHLIPEGGFKKLPTLCGAGVMVVGDAAMLVNNLHWEGTNLAMISGKLAGETAVVALSKGDFSENALNRYAEELEKTFVMKDLKTYRELMDIVHTRKESFLKYYLKKVNSFFEMFTSVNSVPKRTLYWNFIKNFFKDRSIKELFKDALAAIKLLWSILIK